MIELRHRLLARISSDDNSLQGAYSFVPDWYPAEEALRFGALRQGLEMDSEIQVRLEPVWADDGPPLVKAIRASLQLDSHDEIAVELPPAYFRSQIQTEVSKLQAETGEKTSRVTYTLAAFSSTSSTNNEAAKQIGMVIREVFASPVSGERRLARYIECSRAIEETKDATDDFPLFIPSSVLKEAERLKVASAENETGGTLIGHVWRDLDSAELFGEVTALLPVQHAEAKSTKLTFTPQTWSAVHQAISLRGRNEQFLGWAHTHPSRYWCKCDINARKNCPLGRQFFSADDMSVHRAVFSKAYSVALVTGDEPDGEGEWHMVHSLWGWRNGMIESRGFYVLEEDPSRLAAGAVGTPA